MPRRLLVIAYYFPPMGMSGVQRVTKLVKYLPHYGWQPTVLTVMPGGYFAFDASLEQEVAEAGVEVIRTRSIDPTRLFSSGKTVAVQRETTRRSLSELSQWVLVPDNKMGWLPFAVRAAKQAAQETTFDAVLSSAPPYTGHLVGWRVSTALGLPLVTDFRDDWVGNPRHVYPTLLHRRLHERMERRVLNASTFSATINSAIQGRLERACPGADVRVFEQGYDPDDIEPSQASENTRCVFTYTGVFYDAQTPVPFLRGLHLALASGTIDRDDVEARFVGLFTAEGRALVQQLALEDVVNEVGYVEHRSVRTHLAQANVLWMMVGRRPGAHSISTGKLFEYMGTRKPILGLVPEGVAAATLKRYKNATLVEPDDPQGIADAIIAYVALWKENRLPEAEAADVEAYDRQRSAGTMASWLDELI